MGDPVVGYDGIYPIFRSASGQCYEWYDPTDISQGYFNVACPNSANYPSTPVPTFPVGGGGGLIQPGGSWYNDLLNTILGLSAIENRGSVSATGVNSYTQKPYNYYGQTPYVSPTVGGTVGANLGGSLQSFIQNNALILLIAGGALLLWKSGRK